MSGKKKMDYHEHDTPEQDEFPDISSVASANECTGLMYRTPVDGAEWESLQQLSSMGIPRVKGEMDGNVVNKLHRAENTQETGDAVKSASGGEYAPDRESTAEKDGSEQPYRPKHMKK